MRRVTAAVDRADAHWGGLWPWKEGHWRTPVPACQQGHNSWHQSPQPSEIPLPALRSLKMRGKLCEKFMRSNWCWHQLAYCWCLWSSPCLSLLTFRCGLKALCFQLCVLYLSHDVENILREKLLADWQKHTDRKRTERVLHLVLNRELFSTSLILSGLFSLRATES